MYFEMVRPLAVATFLSHTPSSESSLTVNESWNFLRRLFGFAFGALVGPLGGSSDPAAIRASRFALMAARAATVEG